MGVARSFIAEMILGRLSSFEGRIGKNGAEEFETG